MKGLKLFLMYEKIANYKLKIKKYKNIKRNAIFERHQKVSEKMSYRRY